MTSQPNEPDVAAAALGQRGTGTLESFYDHSATDVAQAVWSNVKARLKLHAAGGQV